MIYNVTGNYGQSGVMPFFWSQCCSYISTVVCHTIFIYTRSATHNCGIWFYWVLPEFEEAWEKNKWVRQTIMRVEGEITDRVRHTAASRPEHEGGESQKKHGKGIVKDNELISRIVLIIMWLTASAQLSTKKKKNSQFKTLPRVVSQGSAVQQSSKQQI